MYFSSFKRSSSQCVNPEATTPSVTHNIHAGKKDPNISTEGAREHPPQHRDDKAVSCR